MLKVEEISDRLNDRFNLLTHGSRTAVPRHQTLRAAIDWSYDLLSESEQILFRRLAIFSGGLTLEAAEAVCSGGGIQADDTLDLLTHLVDRSLVIVQEQAEQTRYEILETIREYMREKLAESGDHDSVRARHISFFMDLASQAEPELRGPNQAIWARRLDMDIDNFRSALTWLLEKNPNLGAQLAGNLLWFWHIRCYWSEGRDWFARLVADGSGKPLSAQAKAGALSQAGWLAYDEMDNDQSSVLAEQALALCREVDDKPGAAMALTVGGWAAYNQGDQSRARALGEESLALYQEIGLKWGAANAFNLLGNITRAQGDFESAAEFYKGSLDCSREIGDMAGIAYSLLMAGELASYQGDVERAATLTEESLTLSREIGLEWNAAAALNVLGDIARAQGDYERASMFYDECEVAWDRLGNKREMGSLIWSQGRLAALQENHEQAARRFRQGLMLWQEVTDRRRTAECLEGLAAVAVAVGKVERAARLFGAAEMLRDATQSPLSPVERGAHENSVATVRAQLGQIVFENAWAAGRSMNLEQAIEFAMKES
jgi:tetratricopeptide (TPR) repeat protein